MAFALCSLKCSSSSVRGRSSSVCLRTAREEDLDRLVRIDLQCFPGGFWSRTAFRDEIRMPMGQRDFVVAEDLVPEVVGVGCLRQVLDEGSITYLAVSEGSRRRGIGSIVVADLLARCSARGIKRVTLEVAEENSSAISLYKNHRFEIIGRRKNYYAGNVDALVMSLQIESPCEIDSESTAC